MASGQTVTITGNGFIPGSTPNGTMVVDGIGVFQYGAPNSKDPGQAWDDLTLTVAGTGHNTTVLPPAMSGPDGNGAVTVTIDTTEMHVGTYTVTITGRLLTQSISFQVKQPNLWF